MGGWNCIAYAPHSPSAHRLRGRQRVAAWRSEAASQAPERRRRLGKGARPSQGAPRTPTCTSIGAADAVDLCKEWAAEARRDANRPGSPDDGHRGVPAPERQSSQARVDPRINVSSADRNAITCTRTKASSPPRRRRAAARRASPGCGFGARRRQRDADVGVASGRASAGAAPAPSSAHHRARPAVQGHRSLRRLGDRKVVARRVAVPAARPPKVRPSPSSRRRASAAARRRSSARGRAAQRVHLLVLRALVRAREPRLLRTLVL